MTPKTLAVYHSADYDGIFCREVASKFLPNATLIGWNFGQPQIDASGYDHVVVMDLPPTCITGRSLHNIVWIDHHATSIDQFPSLHGYQIDGVAACRLAWQWFSIGEHNAQNRTNEQLQVPLPGKQDFIDRKVSEPHAIRLAGEYDIWDKRDPDAETFQYGLKAEELDDPSLLGTLLLTKDVVYGVIESGRIAQRYAKAVDAGICNDLTWVMEWEGLKFLCVNHARFNSLLFAAKDNPETGHDALLGFRFDGKKWMVSLYHANHRKDLDLSEIAKKHGGGGHRGACGFVCQTLPFPIQ
jgi:hypothetical protein